MSKEKLTLSSRLISGFLHGLIAFIVIALFQGFWFLKSAGKGGVETGMLFISSPILWFGSLTFFVLGVILGPSRMANLWGMIFGTNRKK